MQIRVQPCLMAPAGRSLFAARCGSRRHALLLIKIGFYRCAIDFIANITLAGANPI